MTTDTQPESLPRPLTPKDCELRDFPFMALDVDRLRNSDFASHASGDEFRAAILLWCASWHQIPAASLPDDDVVLAKLAGYGFVVNEWMKLKTGALRGFIKCSDGRLYHPVVAEKANEAWISKQAYRKKLEFDRQRKAAKAAQADLNFSDGNTEVSDGNSHQASHDFPQSNSFGISDNSAGITKSTNSAGNLDISDGETHHSGGTNNVSNGIPAENALKVTVDSDSYIKPTLSTVGSAPVNSSTSIPSPEKPIPLSRRKQPGVPIPENFTISDRVRKWAQEHGHDRLEERFDFFLTRCRSKGYLYVDWDAAFEVAVRDDWGDFNRTGGVGKRGVSKNHSKPARSVVRPVGGFGQSGRI
ncbi:hypothetical protein GALL_118100 [mine drainage metagenome]|uniref:DUF1376 domain-containing protein n=1 Tax=mine drainage metagenome TaxID=410659 RepID=A0A1J5SPN4_9ZZZZ